VQDSGANAELQSGFLWTCSEQAVVRQPGSDTVDDGLEVEDESRRTRWGNADHHAIARLASLLVEHRSRWSGMPSRTGVSQVPHVPSAQEESTGTPAF
jgi:hypothetical protein